MNWWESAIVHSSVAILREALKDPKQAATLKHVSLDIYTAIKEAYADDPDFSK